MFLNEFFFRSTPGETYRISRVETVIGILTETVGCIITYVRIDHIAVHERIGKSGEYGEEVVGGIGLFPTARVHFAEQAPTFEGRRADRLECVRSSRSDDILSSVGDVSVQGLVYPFSRGGADFHTYQSIQAVVVVECLAILYLVLDIVRILVGIVGVQPSSEWQQGSLEFGAGGIDGIIIVSAIPFGNVEGLFCLPTFVRTVPVGISSGELVGQTCLLYTSPSPRD